MESNPGFNLKQAVAGWRLGLAGETSLDLGHCVEMERKLVEAIAGLQNRGLAQQEAFILAARRVDGKGLESEEALPASSLSVWRRRALWMLGAALGAQVVYSILGAGTSLAALSLGDRDSFNWWMTASSYGTLGIIKLGIFALSICLCRRTSTAGVVDAWIGRSGFQKKAGHWCAAIAALLLGLAVFQNWGFEHSARRRYAMAPGSRPGTRFDFRPLILTTGLELPAFGLCLLVYLARSAQRRAAANPPVVPQLLTAPETSGETVDLARAVEDWRRCLAARSGVTGEQAREMASHLHDSAERFLRLELSVEESLWLAKRRLGSISEVAAQLQGEDLVSIWRARLPWAWLGLALWWFFDPGDGMLSTAHTALGFWGVRAMSSPILTLGAMALRSVLLWGILGSCLVPRLKARFPEVTLARAFRVAIWGTAIAMALVAFSSDWADAFWTAIHSPDALSETTYSSGFDEVSSQIFAMFPAPGTSLAGLLGWLFFGIRMQTVLLVVSVYLLARRTTVSVRGDIVAMESV
jgi:hypothetical protein